MPSPPTEFDRKLPLFRAFKSDEDDTIAWHHVSPDFTPGDALTETEVRKLKAHYIGAPWWPQFLARLEENRKATIYASTDSYGVIPKTDLADEVDGVLTSARIYDWGDHRIARGVFTGVDRKGRFRPGEMVRTSYILSGPDENGIIRTRNSVYQLIFITPRLDDDAVVPGHVDA